MQTDCSTVLKVLVRLGCSTDDIALQLDEERVQALILLIENIIDPLETRPLQ